ncbi:RHS repeat-associated core domain-containing protein [Neisseria perflava]
MDGLPLKRTNALGHTFAYAYDKARRLTVLTNENGETYRLDYDQTDNLIQETGWDGKITAYGYDVAGQLVQQTEYGQSNHEGRLKERPETWHIHHFKRNILGQLIEKQSRKVSHKNGQSKDEGISRTRFEYDPITGNLTKARNHYSIVELAYDELDRLIGETTVHNGQSATVGYRYDPLGNRIRTILPDGRHIDYLYYGSGHLHQISLDGEVVSDIERDKLHREIQRTQGSISSLYDYDPMGRLKSQRTVWNGTQTLHGKQNPLAGGAVNRRYAYDKAGNLIQSADQRSGVLNYVYDKIGRIQEARNSQTGRSETFAFDPAHNILSDKTAEGKGKGSNVSSGNRLKEYNGIEYTYDALGNLIYRQLPDGENQYYQYDLENQLVRAEIKKPAGNTEIWTYAYDPFGRRLSKERQDKLAWTSTDPKRTHFVWDGTRLLQEYTYKGCYTYIYTDQDSYEPLAQVFHNNQDEGQYLAYFHNDQIGIPREMTDIHGNLLWYGEYTAWGRLKKDERVYKNAHQPFRLQNQYFDEETGLHYNLMRYYEPEAGRFVNQDPIGLLGGSNLYRFAPNAQGWTDPSGFIAMALVFLPEIGAALTALGQAALTAIGIGAVLSLSGDTSKEKSQAKAQVKAGACHENCKSSKKPQHGYKIYDKRTGQIMEYGISGQTRTKADYFKTENNSPRIRSKLRVKYGGDPNYAGSVMIDGLPNREAALAWEKAQVRAYRAANNGARPPKQYRP